MEIIDGMKKFTDEEIFQGLLDEDESVLAPFFDGKQFQSVIAIIQGKIFHNMNPNSLKAMAFNELYEFLRKDDCKKLREYETEGGNILIWLARTAIHYYQDKRRYELKTEKRHRELLEKKNEEKKEQLQDSPSVNNPVHEFEQRQLSEIIEIVISKMKNKKYAEIMRRELISPKDIHLKIESANISQERKRAYQEFLKLYFSVQNKI